MSTKDVVHEIHKPARKNYPRRRVVVKDKLDLFQADLVKMIPYLKIYKGFKYILTVFSVFLKQAWTILVKIKAGSEVSMAMKKILEDGPIPKSKQTDNGRNKTL